MNHKPTVSFIVPCYELAHLLPECVRSILSQTYANLEVLIMDDCSPDNTAEVARSFVDTRVKHVRNDPNLGHLRNYNKGISMSRGEYVWLISADDYLRKTYVVERYVELMERHRNLGYVFCPGYGVRDGKETRLLGRYSQRLDHDKIFRGHDLVKRLLKSNFVLTPSGMVRRECYEKISLFDLNMPWCGDWYLWCLFALYYDVGYLAEPMLCYREHGLSMTTQVMSKKLEICAAEEVNVTWTIRRRAQESGYHELATKCLQGIARTYGRVMASDRYRPASCYMNFEWFEKSLRGYPATEAEREYLRAQVAMCIGNECYWQSEFDMARQYYRAALKADPSMMTVRIKNMLLALGKPGDYVRKTIFAFR